MTQHKFSDLITLGHPAKHSGGIVNPPVWRASTILFKTMEDFESADRGEWPTPAYGRYGTPTTAVLEETIAYLDGADHAIVTGSGLSAIVTTLLACLKAGDHLLMVDNTYAPTRRFCDNELKRFGVETTYYDPTIGAGIEKLMQPNTRVVYCESPGSLTFEMQDIPAIAKAAHAKGALLVADNTWATPLFFRPFEKGVDVSIHSVTKYMSGHSDLVMGAITCKASLYKQLFKAYKNTGPTPGADNCYLALRGIRSMAARMQMHQTSAMKVAQWLKGRKEVGSVLYPALPDDPGHVLWKRDMTGAASLFSFVLKSMTHTQLSALMNGLNYYGMGYSWGGYESLLIPVVLSKLRTASTFSVEGQLMRIHVGLEHPDDLIADLERGLQRAHAA